MYGKKKNKLHIFAAFVLQSNHVWSSTMQLILILTFVFAQNFLFAEESKPAITGKEIYEKTKSLSGQTFSCNVYEGLDSLDSIEDTGVLKLTKGKQFEISFLSKSKIKFRIEFSASESPSNLKVRLYKNLPEYTISIGEPGKGTAFIISPDNDQTRILKISGSFEDKRYEYQCDLKK